MYEMMFKKYVLALFTLLISTVGFSQSEYQIRQAIDFFNANKLQSGDWKLTQSDIEGSPYLNDEFMEGVVFTTSKTQYMGMPLRYNIFNDQVEFKAQEQVQAIAAPETIEKIEMGDIKLVYAPYSLSKKIRRGYFIVEEEGVASLYRKPEIMFEEAKEPGAYKEAEPAQFKRKSDSYFIRIGKSPAQLVASKKDLEEAFPNHQKEIKQYIKDEKVKPRKEETLPGLIQFYNSLVSN